MTPLLSVEWLRQRIQEARPTSLFVIGTAGHPYFPQYLAEMEATTQGTRLVLEGVNHSLQIPGSVSQSVEALTRIVGELQSFI